MTKRDKTNPITDHALLRYMERVQGIDVEGLRNEIATPLLRAAVAAKATKVISDGMQYRINSYGFVCTVINPKQSGRAPTRRNTKRGRKRPY